VAATTETGSGVTGPGGSARPHVGRRLATETKAAFKTTEFYVYIVASVAVLIAAAVIDEANGGGFGAKQAWLYFTILTVGYMIARGLAKAGSRDPYWQEGGRRPGDDDR
jgi:hypothetical protein